MSLETVHASCVALAGRAALLTGPSGAGKSDLALRCLGLAPSLLVPHSFALVGDDRVALEVCGRRLLATPPQTIRGRLEARSLGILEVDFIENVEVVLVADLGPGAIDRLPESAVFTNILGIDLPVMRLRPFEASAPVKLALALLKNKP